jgi:hypothetical protein
VSSLRKALEFATTCRANSSKMLPSHRRAQLDGAVQGRAAECCGS